MLAQTTHKQPLNVDFTSNNKHFCFQTEPVSHLTTPGILSKHGMDKTLQRDKDLRSPHFVRNRSRSSCREDTPSINTDLYSGSVRRPRSSSVSRSTQNIAPQTPGNARDIGQQMWSWYYGDSGQPASTIKIPGMQSLYIISLKYLQYIFCTLCF